MSNNILLYPAPSNTETKITRYQHPSHPHKLFLNIVKNQNGNVTQASIINMLSPIKCEIIYNKYVTSGLKKIKEMKKEERFACESEISEDELINEVNKILRLDVNRDKAIWTFESYKEIQIFTNPIKEYYDLKDFNQLVKFLEYKKDEEKTYSADFTDSFVQNIFCLSYMFLNNNFV